MKCPTCDSPQPSMHPSMSGGGEVTTTCPDPFHNGLIIQEIRKVKKEMKANRPIIVATTNGHFVIDTMPDEEKIYVERKAIRKHIHEGFINWLIDARNEYPKHEEAWRCLNIMLDEARDGYYMGQFPWEIEDDDK